MPEEMVIDSLGIESDEADEAWESDEAFMEADDSVEDLGEARQRRRGRGRGRTNAYRRGTGVRGMTVRDAAGSRSFAFPERLATTAETNRGLASQELARRALEQRIERLETRNRNQLKNGAAISGIVTLGIGGGLTAISLFKAAEGTGPATQNKTVLSRWADQETAKMATLSSVTQLATTGATMLVGGRYHHSGIGIAADAFAAVQIAGYTLATLLPSSSGGMRFTAVDNEAQLNTAATSPGAAIGDYVFAKNENAWFVLAQNSSTGGLTAVPLSPSVA
jgi:hypothetical protein